MILPLRVLGSSATTITWRGFAIAPISLATGTTATGEQGAPIPVTVTVKVAEEGEGEPGMKGGSANDNPFYKLFSLILLFISYLLFCVATLLFVNACINLHKASFNIVDITRPISIDHPIFEYLKSNNFMYVDKFMLVPQSPVFISFASIIGFSVFCIFLIGVYWKVFNKELFDSLLEINKPVPLYIIIKYFPYLYILIILSTFHGILGENARNIGDLFKEYNNNIVDFNTDAFSKFNNESNKSGSNFLKELKSIIIRNIYKDEAYNEASIITELEGKLNESNVTVKAVFNTDDSTKIKITNAIFVIYNFDYKYIPNPINKEEDNIAKDIRQDYIKYIDYYFNLLINDAELKYNNSKISNNSNYYAKFYLIGLIKNSEPLPDDKKKAREALLNVNKNMNQLKLLNEKLNITLDSIKRRLEGYYITAISFYVLLLILLLAYYFEFDRHKIWISFCNLLLIYNINTRSLIIIGIMILVLLICIIVYIPKS